MRLKWFSVKTIYCSATKGRPKKVEKRYAYDPEAVLIEERIVLIRARDFDDAIRRAEKEAEMYAKETKHCNPYMQKVHTKYLGLCEACELIDDPKTKSEIFSSTRIMNRKVSNPQLEEIFFGKEETKADKRKRLKFLNSEFWEEKGETRRRSK